VPLCLHRGHELRRYLLPLAVPLLQHRYALEYLRLEPFTSRSDLRGSSAAPEAMGHRVLGPAKLTRHARRRSLRIRL
jgi:hypothetical protein